MAVLSPGTPVPHAAARVIARDVHWIGALDPELRRFDLLLDSAHGTTYNAYCVRGSAGVAIVDTVKEAFADEFFRRLESVADYDEIRAIVLNHLEPDHSGALPELRRRAPKARLYVSSRAQMMLKGVLHGTAGEFTAVQTGDHLDLGDRRLRFLQTPYLHWPDTQCTYLEGDALLFSGDIFGSHYCDARLFNDAVGSFRAAFAQYYACIMRPFAREVRQALALIEPLPLRLIAPAHGPILRDAPAYYLSRYRELSTPSPATGEHTLLVFYLSAYGNTRRMAEELASAAASDEVRVELIDLDGAAIAPLLERIERADAIACGSPTINGDAVKAIWDLLSSLTCIDVRGKIGAAFGSYGWSGEAVRMIEERLRGLKLRTPLPGVRARLTPGSDELAACRSLGHDLALHLCGRAEHRTIDMASLA